MLNTVGGIRLNKQVEEEKIFEEIKPLIGDGKFEKAKKTPQSKDLLFFWEGIHGIRAHND